MGKNKPTPDSPKQKQAKEVADRVDVALAAFYVKHRENPGWSELVRIFGWSPATLSEIRKGKRPLRLAELTVIADRFGVRGGWLAAGEEPILEPEKSPEELAAAKSLVQAPMYQPKQKAKSATKPTPPKRKATGK